MSEPITLSETDKTVAKAAALIAAAPDLLKAAKRALAVFRARQVHRDGNNVVAALEDAISKASGGVE